MSLCSVGSAPGLFAVVHTIIITLELYYFYFNSKKRRSLPILIDTGRTEKLRISSVGNSVLEKS